jgi:hypothetical protein
LATDRITPFSGKPVGSAVQPCPLKDKPVHWIEIELVGEDDMPIPWVAYKIRLPDATEAKGFLDSDGFARLDGIVQPGTCAICFPELDGEAWTFIESQPARPALP